MAKFNFKKCELSNLSALRKISIETFTETYQTKNTEENFNKHVNQTFSTSQLTNLLLNSKTTFYLLYSEPGYRESRKALIGYLKLNEGNAQTEKMQEHCFELERIYLTEEAQGKGFGKILIDKSIELAKAKKKKDKAMKKDKKEKKMSKKRNRLDRDSNDEANSNPFDQ